MRWTGHTAHMGDGKHITLVRRLEGKRLFGRCRYR